MPLKTPNKIPITQKSRAVAATLLCLLFLAQPTQNVKAQENSDVKFGKISATDFDPQKYTVADTSTGAVIIADIGSTAFVGNKQASFSYVFKRFTRIKILNQNGFDVATKKIQLYTNDEGAEKLSDIAAAVYNLENGAVVKTPLEKTDIYETRLSKNTIEKKLTLPGIKAGSIIEYSYTITSDFNFNLQQWQFQDVEYPCLWSDYTVSIPNLLVYVFIRQGADSFFINKSWETRGSFLMSQPSDASSYAGNAQELNVGTNVNNHRWVVKNVAPLKVESYVSTPYNYVDKVEFQLYQTSNGEVVTDVANDWKKASADLLGYRDFGKMIDDNPDWLKPTVDEITKNDTSLLQSAQNIYHFAKDNFTCVYNNSFYLQKPLKEVFTSHQGSTSELNLLLMLMMRQKGIPADPVLLSTKEHGFNFTRYPALYKFNYAICKVQVDGVPYYIDCTHPQLPFGSLQNNCYNGLAWVVNAQYPDSVNLSSDLLKEQKTTLVVISNNGDGKLAGSFTSNPGPFESSDIRVAVAKAGEEGYFKKLKNSLPDNIAASDFSIDSLKKIEFPVSVKYNFLLNNPTDDAIYFNPFVGDVDRKNPFTATERNCPVEMPYCLDRVYILSMEVPAGYRVDELPKSVRMKLNESDGLFEYIINAGGNRLQLRCRVLLNKATFAPSDYQSLRDFFTFIIKKQSEQIVFKKI